MKRIAAAFDDERATSPTIGATLLVGITVILATTAGTGMFTLADDAGHGTFATASIDHQPAEDAVKVTWLSNTNAQKLRVTVRVDGERRTVSLNEVGDAAVIDGDGVTVDAGTATEWDDPRVDDGDRVSVTAVAVKDGETLLIAERSENV